MAIVLHISSPARVIAHALSIPSWGACEILFVTGEENATGVLGLLQQLAAKVAEMVAAIPPEMKKI